MNKTCMQLVIVVLLTSAVSLICMNGSLDLAALPAHDNRVVKFATRDSVVCVDKSHLPLIKTLYSEYQKQRNVADKDGIIWLERYADTDGLPLINEALKVRPDEFQSYYNTLSPNNRTLLIKASGQYDDKGKKVMFDVPEITKRLIDIYFPEKGVGLRTYIQSFLGNEDEDYVRNYCREQLICKKGLLTLKQPMLGQITNVLQKDIYPGSLFLNGYCSDAQRNYPVCLYAGDKVHKTYATYFVSNNDEYRIADINNDHCFLWVINHARPDATFSTSLKHKAAIDGFCFSKTHTEIECALTYSKSDMIFSTITMNNGKAVVHSFSVDGPEHGMIVNACFDPVNNEFLVASYENLESRVTRYTMCGVKSEDYRSWSFREDGLLAGIATYQASGQYYLVIAFNVANLCAIHKFVSLNDQHYKFVSATPLIYMREHYPFCALGFIHLGEYLYMADFSVPFFVDNSAVQKKQEQEKQSQSFFANLGNLYDYFVSQPDSEVHRTYSPDGLFLMCNSLINKLGISYVRTMIQDAVNRKEILSIDSLHKNFAGVGFTHDGTELIFLNHGIDLNYKVVLLNNEDKEMLCAIDDVICTSLGVTSLVKRLCMECKEKRFLCLYENDSTYKMLIDWSRKSPILLKALEKCLPLSKMKK
jgi:hypothetical protein